MLKPPHISPGSSSQHLRLHPLPRCGSWEVQGGQHSTTHPEPLLQQEPGSPAHPAYPEMLPGDKERPLAMPGRGVPGRVMGSAAGEEQRAESREAPAGSSARSRMASRMASRAPSCAGPAAGWSWLMLLHRASPQSPGSLPFHVQSEVGKERSTYLVCARLSLLS